MTEPTLSGSTGSIVVSERLPAPASVAMALRAVGWKEFDGVPWMWTNGVQALSWEEATAVAIQSKPPKKDGPDMSWVIKILTSKEAMTVVPIALGIAVDVIQATIPLLANLHPPVGSVVGVALGGLARSLATVIQRRQEGDA